MIHHRLITLYGNEGGMRPDWPSLAGTPAFQAFELRGLANAYEQAAEQMPRVLDRIDYDPVCLSLAPESDERGPRGRFTVTGVQTISFRLPYGGIVLALILAFEAGDLGGCVQLMRDTAFRKRRIRLDGSPLGARIATDQERQELTPEPFVVGRIHQLFVDDDAAFFRVRPKRRPVTGRSGTGNGLYADLDLTRINLIMNHDLNPYREGNSRVSFPREANQEPDALCALTPSTTILAGYSPDLVDGLLLAAVQCVASADRAAWIRDEAYSTLHRSGVLKKRPPADQPTGGRQRLTEFSSSLGRLEMELSFGVEAYLDVSLLLPDERAAAYQRQLAHSMGLPMGVSTIQGMLDRLASTIAADRAEVERDERVRDDRRAATWGWVTSIVALFALPATLILGFLGVNASEVKNTSSIFTWSYWPYYATPFIILAVGAWVGWLMGRRS
jgi:hypothetical protein